MSKSPRKKDVRGTTLAYAKSELAKAKEDYKKAIQDTTRDPSPANKAKTRVYLDRITQYENLVRQLERELATGTPVTTTHHNPVSPRPVESKPPVSTESHKHGGGAVIPTTHKQPVKRKKRGHHGSSGGLSEVMPSQSSVTSGQYAEQQSSIGAILRSSTNGNAAISAWNSLRNVTGPQGVTMENRLKSLSAVGLAGYVAEQTGEVISLGMADVDSLEATVAGLAGLAVAWGIGWVENNVGVALGDVSVLGWHPFSWVKDGLTKMGLQMERESDTNAKALVDLILKPVTLFKNLVTLITDAIAHEHNAIADFIGHTSETMVKTLVKDSVGATLDASNFVTHGEITHLIEGAISGYVKEIETYKSDLETSIKSISSTLGEIHSIKNLITTQLAPFIAIGAVSLPVAFEALSNTVAQTTTTIQDCMVSNCDSNSPNNIKNVLKSVLKDIMAAAEIGFIYEAVKDPEGTANVIEPILDQIVSGPFSDITSLLGILD